MGHVQQPLGHSKVTTYRTDHVVSGNDTGCNATVYLQDDAPSIPAEAYVRFQDPIKTRLASVFMWLGWSSTTPIIRLNKRIAGEESDIARPQAMFPVTSTT